MEISQKSSTFKRKRKAITMTDKSILLERREEDFLAAYDKVVKTLNPTNIIINTTEICKIVAHNPAPCFYVSLEQALYQYRLYKQGRSNIKWIEKRKMYAEIFTRFEYLMELSGGKAYQYTVMEAVLNQEAPSFYLTDESAVYFYYNAMRKKKQKAKRKR